MNSKREPDEWRSTLKKGDKIDALDRCGNWYEATVVCGEERSVCIMPMIKVGFRQYQTDGPKNDEMGDYYGYGSTADEHIGSYTVRIQPVNTYSKTGMKTIEVGTSSEPSASNSGNLKSTIEQPAMFKPDQDEADLEMIKQEGQTIFATERPKHKSVCFVWIVN